MRPRVAPEQNLGLVSQRRVLAQPVRPRELLPARNLGAPRSSIYPTGLSGVSLFLPRFPGEGDVFGMGWSRDGKDWEWAKGVRSGAKEGCRLFGVGAGVCPRAGYTRRHGSRVCSLARL